MVTNISNTFVLQEGRGVFVLTNGVYGDTDVFYETYGCYQLFLTYKS
ncbi:intracellular sulfur oxidation protein DsrH [Capnocytophaga sp. oral taxon 338 str. F0234]|nr:intracellular sulfur oxidation protein DsrH [Capnocytophaga sp. oral taxon 338 str. F0234]